ncbi:hypothetical protein TNCV_4249341 [Trichonephila clavipes]|nr:hypothetical protein TNCV_4249341 [Trichonephila clavipes]
MAGRPLQHPGQASGDILPGSNVRGGLSKLATASALFRCLWIGPPITKVPHGLPRLLGFLVVAVHHLPMYVVIVLFALLRVKESFS